MHTFHVITFFSLSGEDFVTNFAWEYTLGVSFAVFAQSSDRNVPNTTFVTAVVPIVTAHVMIEILERYVYDRTDNATEILPILQTEW